MDQDETTLTIADGLARITLNRPTKANALSPAMRQSLQQRLDACADDTGVHTVILSGAGASFCGGLDLNDLPDTPQEWHRRVLAAQRNHTTIVRSSKIVVASVQGAATGGGASLALSADILVMEEDAYLSFPFVRLGIVPDGGSSYILQAKLGVALATDLLLTGGRIDSHEAQRLGLTQRIAPKGKLAEEIDRTLKELASSPSEAKSLTKLLCQRYWTPEMESVMQLEAELFTQATSSTGHLSAIEAIKNLRKHKTRP